MGLNRFRINVFYGKRGVMEEGEEMRGRKKRMVEQEGDGGAGRCRGRR